MNPLAALQARLPRRLPRRVKLAVKARLRRWRLHIVRALFSYDRVELLAALRALGVRPGDSLLVHSRFDAQHGFDGTVAALIDTLVEAVGAQGHLLMVSMAYHGSALQYLRTLGQFDVRRTPSMMGLVSESFRRRVDVLERSLRAAGLLHERRIGNSRLIALRVRAVVAHVRAMAEHGESFYDLPAPAPPA